MNGLIAYAVCQAGATCPSNSRVVPRWAPRSLPAGSCSTCWPGSRRHRQRRRYRRSNRSSRASLGVRERKAYGHHGGGLTRFHDSDAGDPIKVRGVTLSTASLRFHYTVEATAFQVIVTDTRTWRTFVRRDLKPALLHASADDQLRLTRRPSETDSSLVVCSTNVPPVADIRMLGRITMSSDVNEFDAYDAWDLPSMAFDSFVLALTSKFAISNSNKFAGAVVILSGDIHFSFSSRMTYWAEIQRLMDMPGHEQTGQIVIGQLVSSSFKNEQSKTIGVQEHGYQYMPPKVEAMLRKLTVIPGGIPIAAYIHYSGVAPPNDPESYAGWNIREGRRKIGKLASGVVASGESLYITSDTPTHTPT